MTTCPTPESLDDLIANRLPADEAERVREHFAGCAACQRRQQGASAAEPPPAQQQQPPASKYHPYLSPPRQADELGWLGSYRIVGVLGEGGMSVVFDAEEPMLHRRVALKVLKTHLNDAVSRERFLHEARALASLPSDHVVHLYAVGEDNGVPYLAMERLSGESLAARLKRDHWLPVSDALRIAREAAEGLEVLHQRAVVHRDVKPENLWLEADGQGRFLGVKLIDFGIAKRAGLDVGLTQVGQFVGTPTYAAPEQAAGNPVDGRADLYSLGCVLYRMVTGKLPFGDGAPDTIAVLQAVLKGDAPDVAELAPNLSPDVAELIGQLMQRDPDDRPPNAAAVVGRLRQLEQEERGATSKTQMIQTVPSAEPTRRTARQVPVVSLYLGAGAIAIALVVSAVAIYHRYWSDTNKVPAAAPLSGEPVKVGVLFSRRGDSREHEAPIIDAVQLAIDEINQPGQGVLGRPVESVVAEGGSDENRFAQEAERLIRQEEVAVIVGCWSSAARRRVTEVCRKHDRLLFYPPGDEGLEISDNLVYLGGTPNQTVTPLVKYLYSHSEPERKIKGRRKFFLVGSETVYSYALNDMLEHEVLTVDAKVVGVRYLLGSDRSDAGAVAEAIKKSGADCVIVSVDGVASNEGLLRALRERKLKPPEVITAWLSLGEAELERLPVDDLQGDYSAACYFESLPTKANRDFVARFKAKYGKGRHVNDAMQSAYAGVHLRRKAVEQAGTFQKTAAVREALRGMTIEAPDGPMKIGDDLHAWRTARVGVIESKGGAVGFRIVYQSPEPMRPVPFPEWRSRQEWRDALDELYEHFGGAWGRSKN